MGFIHKALKFLNYGSAEDPGQPLIPNYLDEDIIGRPADSGANVTHKSALGLTAASGCIRYISEDLAALPFSPLYVAEDGSVVEAKNNRLYSLVHDRPNDEMTSVTFRFALVANMLTYGAAFAYIERDNAARPVALILLASSKTAPIKIKGELMFATTQTANGDVLHIAPENVLHIPFFTMDGITSMSPIMMHRNALGISMAAEKFAGKFYANGARSTGVFTFPGQLEDEPYQRLVESLHRKSTGDNALRPLVLEDGLTWQQQSIPPNEAQFLETRQYQVAEVARIYRMPLHMLQSLDRSTFSNIEHQGMEYIQYCLKPIAVRIEQEFNRKLLPTRGLEMRFEHDFYDLSRGDLSSMATAYGALRNGGFVSVDDGRRKFRMNPIGPENGGDVYLAPINYQPLRMLTEANYVAPTTTPKDTNNESSKA